MPKAVAASLVAAVLAATSLAASPGLAASKTFEELFGAAVTDAFTAQIAGTYPARNEILVKIANGDQFALPVASGVDLGAWATNDVVRITNAIGAVTDISPAQVAEPAVSYAIVSDDLAGVPEDTVARSVTYSLPAERITVTDAEVTFVGPSGNAVTVPLAEGVTVQPIRGEFATITYFDAVSVERSE
jgi:hypothetical protein